MTNLSDNFRRLIFHERRQAGRSLILFKIRKPPLMRAKIMPKYACGHAFFAL